MKSEDQYLNTHTGTRSSKFGKWGKRVEGAKTFIRTCGASKIPVSDRETQIYEAMTLKKYRDAWRNRTKGTTDTEHVDTGGSLGQGGDTDIRSSTYRGPRTTNLSTKARSIWGQITCYNRRTEKSEHGRLLSPSEKANPLWDPENDQAESLQAMATVSKGGPGQTSRNSSSDYDSDYLVDVSPPPTDFASASHKW